MATVIKFTAIFLLAGIQTQLYSAADVLRGTVVERLELMSGTVCDYREEEGERYLRLAHFGCFKRLTITRSKPLSLFRINVEHCTINLKAADTDNIVIDTVVLSDQSKGPFRLSFEKKFGQLVVEDVSSSSDKMRLADITIWVPTHVAIELYGVKSDVSLENIRGKFLLTVSDGSLKGQNIFVEDSLRVSSKDSQIDLRVVLKSLASVQLSATSGSFVWAYSE